MKLFFKNKIDGRKVLSKAKGYTIIETMIAVSLFIIIVMIGMEALLNANQLDNKSQNMRSIMDNMSFVMEDMSKNLRTGTSYECIPPNGTLPILSSLMAHSGQGCGGVAFKPATGGALWIYYIGANPKNNLSIFKKVDTNPAVQLTPDDVSINSISGFSILGAEPPPADNQQPFIIIHLIGTIQYQKITTPFSLQTSVSQRQIDI